jgi:hypothetical protein
MAATCWTNKPPSRKLEMFQNDAEAVGFAASALEISEHRLFQLAHADWFGASAAADALDSLFREYLATGGVPFWVRSFTRKVVEGYEAGGLDPTALSAQREPSTARERRIGWSLMMLVICLLVGYSWMLIWVSDAIERYWRP